MKKENTVKTMSQHGFTQFELTKEIVTNLQQFKLTPTAKLVLILLTTHYNEEKNGAVVFPSMPYIAETLGIGLTATKQAIKDLINEGLLIKAKRGEIKGNYNKYLLTPKVRKTTDEQSQNELFKKSDSDLSYIGTNKQEQKKEQTSFDWGENVYSTEEYCVLKDYAIKHNARNINAYIAKLKANGSDKSVLKEHRKKAFITQRAKTTQKETQQLIAEQQELSKTAILPSASEAWKNFGEKIKVRG